MFQGESRQDWGPLPYPKGSQSQDISYRETLKQLQQVALAPSWKESYTKTGVN